MEDLYDYVYYYFNFDKVTQWSEVGSKKVYSAVLRELKLISVPLAIILKSSSSKNRSIILCDLHVFHANLSVITNTYLRTKKTIGSVRYYEYRQRTTFCQKFKSQCIRNDQILKVQTYLVVLRVQFSLCNLSIKNIMIRM